LRKHQNLHTHTTYVDGYVSAEEMVLTAIKMNGSSIGFSEHSHVPFDLEYSLSIEDIPKYIDEVNALKEKYADKIEIFLGIEQDYFTDNMPDGLDYVIGTTHHIQCGNEFITVDAHEDRLIYAAKEYFNGDFYALSERYFETMSDIMNKTHADIIGHFDLLTKHNTNNSLFDETNPRYTTPAIDAMKEILKKNNLFEINTGAMFRIGKTEQYPATFLLKELQSRGGEVILSSDTHDPKSLYYNFDEIVELIKSCKFKHIKRLTKNGFVNVDI